MLAVERMAGHTYFSVLMAPSFFSAMVRWPENSVEHKAYVGKLPCDCAGKENC